MRAGGKGKQQKKSSRNLNWKLSGGKCTTSGAGRGFAGGLLKIIVVGWRLLENTDLGVGLHARLDRVQHALLRHVEEEEVGNVFRKCISQSVTTVVVDRALPSLGLGTPRSCGELSFPARGIKRATNPP